MKNFSQFYLHKITFCLGCGIACWILLLLKQLQVVQNTSQPINTWVMCGPLTLSELIRQSNNGTFTVKLTLSMGLLLFLLCWATAGCLWGFVIYRIHKHFTDKTV